MGLSGRKTKQRIPHDPRNLAWANDASKFGAAYLAKLGWDSSRGLGPSGEGRTSALTVHHKLDMLGIGADHRNSAEGLAWKQNKDFENLLRRLNAANGNDQAGEPEEGQPLRIDGFVKPTASSAVPGDDTQGEVVAEEQDGCAQMKQDGDKKSKKKRKKGADDGESEERSKKRKKSKSSADRSETEEISKREKKRRKKRQEETEAETPAPSLVPTRTSVHSRNPRALFRAKHLAAKDMASKSASSIAEVLGLAPTPSTSAYPSSAPTPYPPITPFSSGPSTSSSSGPSGVGTPSEDVVKLQDLTVSSKSVMDYFKEKLAAKSNARVFGGRSTSSPSTPAAEDTDDYDARPRIGLGASRLQTDAAVVAHAPEPVEFEERRSLGGIGGGMRSSFAAMFTAASGTVSIPIPAEPPVVEEEEPVVEEATKRRKHKGETRRKEKKKNNESGEECVGEVPDGASGAGAPPECPDEQEARRRRKEEKRRRKEARVQAKIGAAADEDRTDVRSESEEGKRKKEKRKSKRVENESRDSL